MKKTIIIVLCALALAGCAPGYAERQEEVSAVKARPKLKMLSWSPSVYRLLDEEAGIVCYVVADSSNTAGQGIACLPIAQTTLDGGR